ncbi:indole-3-glycerol phosphate synthase [Halovivax cerinus]|uniref:Indole-3-glycerol phosphate synthase n=1 Tax=Halovivax cerinus TaxID=1487865 RepID=A0ABD5NLM9_9EURY|nr:indole-3-glycerol phosphate synthase [Halovivax cerinus]
MMTCNELAAPVRSILTAARDRSQPDGTPLAVSPRSLPQAIRDAESDGRVPIVAEIKPTSPTTDGRRTDDPVELARAMIAGGATALSVLTEPDHFGGSPEALERVRQAVDVPVLRKDFILREEHLDVVAADLVLVIARFVDDLPGLVTAARDRGFQVLVEVHTREELRAALDAGARFVGINNRDLAALEVDLSTFEHVVGSTGDGGTANGLAAADNLTDRLADVTLVAESGVSTPDDVRRLRGAGADALLVGSAIMDGDVEANTRRLVEAGRPEDGRTDADPKARSTSEQGVDAA